VTKVAIYIRTIMWTVKCMFTECREAYSLIKEAYSLIRLWWLGLMDIFIRLGWLVDIDIIDYSIFIFCIIINKK